MIQQTAGMTESLLFLLAKGVAWLALCGLIQWGMPRSLLSWRLGLTGLALLTLAGLLPSLWTWTLPPPSPALPNATPTTFQAPWALEPSPSLSDSPAVIPEQTAPSAWMTMADFPWQTWPALLWLGGSVGLCAWLLNGFLTARRWTRQGVPPADPSWQEILGGECRLQTLRRNPRLLVNPDVPGPCVTGCFRPVILLPTACQDWDAATRTLVIRHELAHLRHHDPRHAWVRALTLTIHWLNPLVWFAISRSRHAEELAADAAVLASGIRPDHYAATLLRVARSCQFTPQIPLITAMAHSSNLESRILHLLGKKPAPQSPVRFAAAGIGLTWVTAGIIGCSSVQRESRDPNNWDLPGAPTPITPIDSQELKGLLTSDRSNAKKFTVKLRVIDAAGRDLPVPNDPHPSDGRIFSHALSIRIGQKGRFESIREFPYPTRFDPAGFTPIISTPGTEGSFPVTPTTPAEFAFRNTGWKTEMVTVKPEGAFLTVAGTFHETIFDGFIRNAGEAYSTIVAKSTNALGIEEDVVLTDNKVLSPTFTTRETPFRVAALPGKSYRLRLNLKQPDAFLEISCSPD